MNVREAAKELEVSADLVYRLCRAGKLGHRRIGLGRGVVRIDREHIEAYKRESEADIAVDEGPKVKKVRGEMLVIPNFEETLKRIKAYGKR